MRACRKHEARFDEPVIRRGNRPKIISVPAAMLMQIDDSTVRKCASRSSIEGSSRLILVA